MRVALIGGTGFVGSYLVEQLQAKGHQPVLLVRPGSEQRVAASGVEQVAGEVEDTAALRQLLTGCDAAIYLVGILRAYPERGITFERLQQEGAERSMELAQELGVGRFLLMSANGVRGDGTAYQRTKFAAEEALRKSTLRWTIFRPSVIFGDPRGRMEFATQLYRDLVAPPLPAPLFHAGVLPLGAGSMALSPVYVGDVAALFVAALEDAASVGQCYPVGGPVTLSWKEILQVIARATGRRMVGVPVPAWGVKLVAGWLERFEAFPITRDQVTMLMEGNVCDAGALFARLAITPTPFAEDALGYLRSPGPSA